MSLRCSETEKFFKFFSSDVQIICFSYHYTETQIWKKILSQTNILDFFLSSVPYNTVAKILQSNCKDATKKYIPALLMWLNRVFTDLANTNKRYCLTIDCSGVNKNNSPGRYRTQADDVEKQFCSFTEPNGDGLYNIFISNKIKTENFGNGIYFKINRVQDKDETFHAEKNFQTRWRR